MGAPWQPRGPDDLDEDHRARIRHDVLAAVRGHPPTLRDRLYDAVALIGLPAPMLARALAATVLVVGLATSASVASAEALPDQPLYTVKLATEEVRLALAQTPEDRAAVRLSMAEHRLIEAQELALEGMEPQAIVASSSYGAELASAAAELASIEGTQPASAAVLVSLRERLVDQQRLASRVAAQLAADPVAAPLAPVFRAVASVPPSLAPDMTMAEAIALHAADVTTQLSAVADRLASGASQAARTPAITGREAGPAEAATPARPPAAPQSGHEGSPAEQGAARPAARPPSGGSDDAAHVAQQPAVRAPAHVDPRAAEQAAERAKQEAEKAHEAAKKAQEEAKKHQSSTPRAGRGTRNSHP